MKISQNARRALMIGTLCSLSYLAVYVARNILSAVTPQIVESGAYTDAFIGEISFLYFMCYAIGQLINGAIGDKIHAKYMISLGLLFAGITSVVFPYLGEYPGGATAVYGMTGFFLSMIYGPMTKIVSENTDPIHATRCSLGYTFASFLGSPAAGLLATFLTWQSVFLTGGTLLVVMAVICFVFFAIFERKGIVRYGQYQKKEKGSGNIKALLEREIVKFSLISILTGVVRTSVVFWLPTYISQHLGFSPQEAATIFTVATLAISLSAFLSVFVYELMGYNMNRTILLMFSVAAVFFLLTYFVQISAINIVCIVIAIMGSNGAASMLWSRYCPSLRDTGMVSSATGFLDFLSYMAAAVANLIFPGAVASIGWGNLVLVWLGIVLLGVIISLPYKRRRGALQK